MRVFWIALLCFVLVSADDAEFGPNAWSCSTLATVHGSDSASSDEDAHRCACNYAPDGLSSVSWTKLDCSRRGFESVANGHGLPYHVRSLDLSSNHIRFFEGGLFGRFRPLEKLDISHNGLINISDHAFAGLTALTVLNLSHNNLDVLLESHLMNLSGLNELDLSWNDLRSLPPHLFRNISGLDRLSLSGNIKMGQYIHESPDALKDVLQRGLRCLKLNHIQLTVVPENMFNLAYNLEELYITDNGFTKLPDLYVGSLQKLDVSGSNILVLVTGNFLFLPNLEILHMNRMKNLSSIEVGAFIGLKHLKELSFEKCLNLTTFDGMAFGGPSYSPPPLRNFSLKHSGLQTLSKKLLQIISGIEHLKLQGNPWDCDCRLMWFKELNFSKDMDHHIKCYFPPYLHNKTISSLSKSEFVCMTKKARLLHGLVVCMAVLFALIALLVIGAYVDSLRRKHCLQRRSHRIRYDPMMVQLHPNNAENYWEDNDGQGSISFIRESRVT